MKPAPARSTSVNAISATTSALVQRRARMPPEPDRPPASFMTSFTSVLEMCRAGARPNTMAVAKHTPTRKTNTIGSIVNFM